MKAIRIAALGVALVIGVAATASAQGGAQQQGGPGRRPNMLMVGIDSTLTAEQKAKIDDINKKYQPEQQAIRDAMQAGGDRAEAMKKSADLRAKMQPEIRAVLTATQQAIFDKNVEEMAKRANAPRPAAPPQL
jgi:Spy/CpxP family protein refolding chaperone